MDTPFERQELNYAFANIKVRKSPGPDSIPSGIPVYGGQCLRAYLLNFYYFLEDTEHSLCPD